MAQTQQGLKRAAEDLPASCKVPRTDLSVPTAITDEMDQFLERTWNRLKQYWNENSKDDTLVVQHLRPEALKKALNVSLAEPDCKADFDTMYESIDKVLQHSVRTSHPRFMNMLYGNTDIMGILGEVVATFCNTNIHTYEVSPVFSLMEREVIRVLCDLIGLPGGDGVFAPGGSMCNMFAMLMARNSAVPDIKEHGFGGKTLVAFTSAECHYSIQKGANLIGIGTRNVRKVKTNHIGQMIPEDLDRQIQEVKALGQTPFFVNSTAGTTVKGAFDDLHALAVVCKKHSLWLHVDAAWGGSVCMSPARRHLLSGMDKVDSVTWDPHKGMGVPLQCAVVLTRRQGELMKCNQFKAEYLFKDENLAKIVARGEDKTGNAAAELEEKQYDLGDKSLQCGRHVDVLKIWMMFKRHGQEYFERRVENGFQNRDFMMARMARKPEMYQIVSPPMGLNLCFWYIPPKARGLPDGPERKRIIDAAVQSIRRSIVQEGRVFINYQPQGELPNFFRPIFNSSCTTTRDVALLMDRIEHFGEQL
eukprot:TRINITY_DN6569_c0_g1_i1.p2 TRINITY_DN6569_c0_g1~~TRINITY_DN6569_c0_g1_i1.p2  ORF type:complete len:531 (+),score=225.34 TRINITY_DN6569_c0_g1_i1:62-1654(+)